VYFTLEVPRDVPQTGVDGSLHPDELERIADPDGRDEKVRRGRLT
jgi:hypothetical protein